MVYSRIMTVLPTPASRRYTLAEYLAFEESTDAKNEFHDGEILAMSGASPEHALVTANMIMAVGNALRGKPCRVYSSDLKIGVSPSSRVYYPDASIICGAREYHPDDPGQRIVTNPRVIIEVLSATTEGYDRGSKFIQYRRLASLQEYLLISQTEPLIETFERQPDGKWLIAGMFAGIEARAAIRSVQIEIALSDVYAGVTYPPPAPPPDPRERETL
jgi:Uma2 family endonuclease